MIDIPKEVEDNIYSFAVDDLSSRLSISNTKFGLAKIDSVLKDKRINKSPTCVFGPDAGITRNFERWKSGFGYGCVIRWPEGFAFPEMKPNSCGMILVRLDEVPSYDDVVSNIVELRDRNLKIDDIEVIWDFGKSNHFVEVYEATESKTDEVEEGEVFALLHTSASEKKHLMYDFDKWQDRGGRWVDTAFGEILTLEGDLVDRYFREYKELEEFSIKKRRLVAEEILPDLEVVSNPTHQGLFDKNEIRLGLYEAQEGLFPLSFNSRLPVYLIRPNSSSEIPKAGEELYSNKAVDLNLLPHGGGYKLSLSESDYNIKPIIKEGNRFFAIKPNDRDYVLSNPSNIPFDYRGTKVLDKVREFGLGEAVVKLEQRYTIKI
ncbi:MAG: hypothetical protein BTN85_0333 [Candidatus Methanohalarchaeum thermophilum]|uniref:Uncharacterized protein n=1 Tax=Methanohalarchaeum thermophilum TaxID=1903181 RepID=A0A1Q6DU38_METT1|nr:MAG: hypothetical protein BTN85_0333 [Candidatus Methanohalarchaeum thermophilum]